MNCDDLDRQLGEYLEGRLPTTVSKELEAHAAQCARCGSYLKTALEITCREVVELYDYIEGSLDPARRAVFERHFKICPPCVNYLESYRRTIALSQEALRPAPGQKEPALSEQQVRAILDRRPRQP